VKRLSIAALVAATAAFTASAALGSATPTVKLARTSIGKILVTSKNRTLYMFTHDKHGKDTCVGISMCTGTWPPYLAKSKPVAGPGVKESLLGTIKLPNGKKQVTYAGHPLYTYAFDSGPKATDYAGTKEFGGNWDAVSATGKLIK
jgi:predicted lipoprotein with Yx(FWY)xxD motif